MSEALKRGDLCKIVDHPDWEKHIATAPARIRSSLAARRKQILGVHVILVREASSRPRDPWAPRWHVAGMPPRPADSKVHSNDCPSEKILEKIPPPPLDETDIHELEELSV